MARRPTRSPPNYMPDQTFTPGTAPRNLDALLPFMGRGGRRWRAQKRSRYRMLRLDIKERVPNELGGS